MSPVAIGGRATKLRPAVVSCRHVGRHRPLVGWVFLIFCGSDEVAVFELDEVTINWHINEACNFSCNYCYAKWGIDRSPFREIFRTVIPEIASLAGKVLPVHPQPFLAKRIRLNFAGGEPFLAKGLESAIALAAESGLSPSFITNGVLLRDDFVMQFGGSISVAGFSVDSFSAETRAKIGRRDLKGRQLTNERLQEIFSLFRERYPATKLKINTVVCRENLSDDMHDWIDLLKPDRWKMLRVIPIHGARAISDDEYESFVRRHADISQAVAEDNDDMHRSYLMINPKGRFYQRNGDGYVYGKAIQEVGAANALGGVEFNIQTYAKRY